MIIELIYLVLTLLYNTAASRQLFWTYLLLPAALILQVLFLMGVNYITSSFGAYWRDIKI